MWRVVLCGGSCAIDLWRADRSRICYVPQSRQKGNKPNFALFGSSRGACAALAGETGAVPGEPSVIGRSPGSGIAPGQHIHHTTRTSSIGRNAAFNPTSALPQLPSFAAVQPHFFGGRVRQPEALEPGLWPAGTARCADAGYAPVDGPLWLLAGCIEAELEEGWTQAIT